MCVRVVGWMDGWTDGGTDACVCVRGCLETRQRRRLFARKFVEVYKYRQGLEGTEECEDSKM